MTRNTPLFSAMAAAIVLALGAANAGAQTDPTPPVSPPPVNTLPPDDMGRAPVNSQMDKKPMQDQMHRNMPKSSVMWKDIDVNQDGFISKDELASYPTYQRDFEKHDSNGDGKISQMEWTAWQQMEHPHDGG